MTRVFLEPDGYDIWYKLINSYDFEHVKKYLFYY